MKGLSSRPRRSWKSLQKFLESASLETNNVGSWQVTRSRRFKGNSNLTMAITEEQDTAIIARVAKLTAADVLEWRQHRSTYFSISGDVTYTIRRIERSWWQRNVKNKARYGYELDVTHDNLSWYLTIDEPRADLINLWEAVENKFDEWEERTFLAAVLPFGIADEEA